MGVARRGGALLALVAGFRYADRGRWGPYWDIIVRGAVPGPPPDVPREWKLVYFTLAGVCSLVAIGLLLLGAHLLPEVGWLGRFRVF